MGCHQKGPPVQPLPTLPRRLLAAALPIAIAVAGLGPGAGLARAAVSPVVTQVAVGDGHACALQSNHTVICWGDGSEGALGDAQWHQASAWVPVTGITTAIAVASGAHHSCALLADHTVHCWGRGLEGQLGNNFAGDSSLPVAAIGVSGVLAIAAGGNNTCVIDAGHGVQCWGDNAFGQSGAYNVGTSNLFHDQIAGLTTATALAVGPTSCALLAEGSVRCWGRGAYGVLGEYAILDTATPVTVAGIATARSIAVGTTHACAALQSGLVRCWGENTYGELGSDLAEQLLPGPVAGLSGATAVAAGLDVTCALAVATGEISCFGRDNHGQLGRATPATSSSPLKIAGHTNFRSVSIDASGQTACAVLADGTVDCWGLGTTGQIGNGFWVDATTPAPVFNLQPDTTVPVVSKPIVSLRVGALGPSNWPQLGTEVPVTVSWTASDGLGTGVVASSIFRSSSICSGCLDVLNAGMARSFKTGMSITGVTNFAMQVFDGAGNTASTTYIRRSAALVQQGSAKATYTGSWATASNVLYSGGSERQATRAGASVTFSFTGRGVGLVGTTGPGRGKARVYVNGVLAATIDLGGSVAAYRQVVWTRNWTTVATRKVKIVVMATAGRPRVGIDGFVVEQ
jgi:alpha-tubulin suppressor-like RCC1 family protein